MYELKMHFVSRITYLNRIIFLNQTSTCGILGSGPLFMKHSLQRLTHIKPSSRIKGAGNSIMVSISVCQAGHPGSSLAQSACFRKEEFYQHVINCPLHCRRLVHQRPSMCNHVYVIMHVKDP